MDLPVPRSLSALLLSGVVPFALAGPGALELSALVSSAGESATAEEVDLFGVPRPSGPGFDWVRTLHEGAEAFVAIDPAAFPGLVGSSVDVYVTVDRTQEEWDLDPTLTDVSSDGAEVLVVSGVDVASNVLLVDPATLSGFVPAGSPEAMLGVGYDVVVDVDRDGLLGSGDLVDGYTSGAGFWVAADPALPGPHAVTSAVYSGGTFLGQELFYPSDIATLDDVPLVIVSHGNGHNYLWYDHIGEHLASYGYVVMSHQNDTVPGIETASTTTLTNTDYLLGNLDLIEGGVLEDRLDTECITWIGHSRGGEGVARAYDRILDGEYVPIEFEADDIVLISSIAPTDFLGTDRSTPHDRNFHLWVGGADADVTGCVSSNVAQSYHLFARAADQRQSISLDGAGHADFHNGGGSSVATGPCLIGTGTTHLIQKGYLLPLVEYHVRGNVAALDFLVRQYEDLRPAAVPEFLCVEANLQFREARSGGKRVLADWQAARGAVSNDGGVAFETDLPEFIWGRYDDPNNDFTSTASDGMNGMSYCNATDVEAGAVLGYPTGADYFLRFPLRAPQTDWSSFATLSFRMCQTTRNALTISELGDVDFEVQLADANGVVATLSTADYVAGIVEPYQRMNCGSGTGWANEFETVRLPLRGFQVVEPTLDLAAITSLTFLFGASHGSAEARLGLDDIELTTR